MKVAVLLLLGLTACGRAPLVCGLVGPPPPGVAVDLVELDGVRSAVTVCAGDVCRDTTVVPGEPDSYRVVVDPHVHRDGDVPVSVVARRADGRVLRTQGTAHVRLSQPNGPDCDPRQWSGGVRLHDGALVSS